MAAPKFDVLAAARTGGRELGAQIADLTLELAIQQAATQQALAQVAELEQLLAEKDEALEAARSAPAPESQPEA